MSIFTSRPVPAVHTLRVLAHLLRYPDAELRAHLGELSEALHAERGDRRGAAHEGSEHEVEEAARGGQVGLEEDPGEEHREEKEEAAQPPERVVHGVDLPANTVPPGGSPGD